MICIIIGDVDGIKIGIDFETDSCYFDGFFDGSNNGNIEGLLRGYSLVYTDGKVLGSDEGIKLEYTGGKVIVTIL